MRNFCHKNWRMACVPLVGLLCLLAVGCASGRVGTSVVADARQRPTRQPLSRGDALRLKYFYYEAIAQQTAGHYAAGFDLLRHCLTIDSLAPEVYFSLSAYYAEMNEDSVALECMKRAVELNSNNDTYTERLAQAYISTRDMGRAAQTFEQLYARDKSRTDVLNTLLQLYNYEDDTENVLRTLDRMEAVEGSSERIALTRLQVYEQMGDKKRELKELKRLAEEHPLDVNYRLLMGNWYLENQKTYEALKEYNKVLDAEPSNLPVRLALINYYHTVGRDSTAFLLRQGLLEDDATPTETKLQLVRQVVMENEQNGGDSTKVLEVFRHALAKPQSDSGLLQMLAAYMDLKGMLEDSINVVLEQALAVEPDEASVRLQLVQNVWDSEDWDRVIALCQPATEYNPDKMTFYYFLGLAHYQKGEKELTLDVLRRGVSQINEESNKDLASDFYAIMGDIMHEKGQVEEAFAAYDSSLQYKPDNVGTLNNYAYYLSLQERDLPKAEQMSYKTVKAEPQNSTYLDTYAWILFMQQRYEEARIYIDQALQGDSVPSNVVTEHAGDIYAMIGDTERALELWRQAQQEGNDSRVLQRKIKEKKYIKEDE